MFYETYGDVVLQTVQAPKRGFCLQASNGETKILMDIVGMNPMLVPDGTNAYFFGNKVILVTRWSDMSNEEKQGLEKDPITVALHPYACLQMSINLSGRWNDVWVTLPHCWQALNSESRMVDQMIFVFADTRDSEYVTARSVTLPATLQNYLSNANRRSRAAAGLDRVIPALQAQGKESPDRDFCDFLYDACWDKTAKYGRAARKNDPETVPGGIFIEISGDNRVTRVRQNPTQSPSSEDAPSEPMSEEVKTYLMLANRGIAEGMYNLGVCYEHGDGVAQSYEKAVSWYEKAARQDHAKALHNLGVIWYNGFTGTPDHQKAFGYFTRSAGLGDMYGQYNLGICYYRGVGVQPDPVKACEWLSKAAEQGHPEAKKILGMT